MPKQRPSAPFLRGWLDQAKTMVSTDRHPDGRPLGPILRPRLEDVIAKLENDLRLRLVRERHQ